MYSACSYNPKYLFKIRLAKEMNWSRRVFLCHIDSIYIYITYITMEFFFHSMYILS
jgi:hypothetical protein